MSCWSCGASGWPSGSGVRRAGSPTGYAGRWIPAAWAATCVAFRAEMAAQFRRAFPTSLLGLCGMLAVDLLLLVLCLRFVGLARGEVAPIDIAIAVSLRLPFTLFPFSGLGVVGALILGALVESGGADVEATAVARLIVWRVFTVAGPVLMGVAALAHWRRTVARAKA